MISTTHWWWIRHAPCVGEQGIIHGQDDVEADLSDSKAIKGLSKWLPEDGLWLSSNVRRAIETAKEISGGIKPIEIPAFAEQSFGLWNGRRWKELSKEESEGFWTNYGEQKAPKGESFRQLLERVTPKIKKMSAENAGGDLIVVAHAGTIRAALALALDLPLNSALSMSVSNLSLTKIDAFEEANPFAWRVEFANLTVNINKPSN